MIGPQSGTLDQGGSQGSRTSLYGVLPYTSIIRNLRLFSAKMPNCPKAPGIKYKSGPLPPQELCRTYWGQTWLQSLSQEWDLAHAGSPTKSQHEAYTLYVIRIRYYCILLLQLWSINIIVMPIITIMINHTGRGFKSHQSGRSRINPQRVGSKSHQPTHLAAPQMSQRPLVPPKPKDETPSGAIITWVEWLR